MKKISLTILNLVVIAALSSTFAYSEAFLKSDDFKNLEQAEQIAIKLVLKDKEVQDFLEAYPDWSASTYADNETQWHVDFYEFDEWIGNAHTDLVTKEIYDVYLLKQLSDEEYRAGKSKLEELVFNDQEILSILGDADLWDYDISFNVWEQGWEMYFWKGLEEIGLYFWEDEQGRFFIEDIFDPRAFSEQEKRDHERNLAIEIAYGSEGIDQALEGVYDWRTYAEPLREHVWGVEFSSSGIVFYAVVDISTYEIIETYLP